MPLYETSECRKLDIYCEQGGSKLLKEEITKAIQFSAERFCQDLGLKPIEEKATLVYTTKHSNIYHKSNCPELGTEDLIEFNSSQQARNAGGKPCKNCNP